MRNERWDEALADFDAAVAADPTPQTASIYFNRGRVQATRGNHRAAIEDFTRATVINPRWSDPLSWRASSKEQMGDTAGALEDLDQAFARNPSESERQAIARRRAEIAAETNPGGANSRDPP
jgi:tetratricopeptide (TPR) repeat protein